MNILMITPEYPPRSIGGGGIVFKNLSEQLNHEGHLVNVLAGSFSNKSFFGKVETFLENGVTIHFVPLLPSLKFEKFNSATYTFPTINGLFYILKKLIQSEDATIHLHGFCHPIIDLAAFSCVLMNKKYVLTCHGIPKSPESFHLVAKFLFKIYLNTIERTLIKKASALTTVSYFLKKECKAKSLVNENMIVIPNGQNDALNKSSPDYIKYIENKYSLKNRQVIFAIGRLNENKGFQFLVEAMQEVASKLPNVVAVIAGSGPYRDQIENLVTIKGLKENVKVVGWVSEKTRAAMYELSDVVVFPSIEEPFGIVILEAFKMHKPLIAFNTETAMEIINGESGLLVPVGDSSKMANAIVQVITDPLLNQKLVANTSLFKASSWEKITIQYLEVYKSLNNQKITLKPEKQSTYR